LSYSDVKAGFNLLNSDVEDSVHYVLSQKMRCDAIFTNNKKDFVFFDISTIVPDLGLLKITVK
jgi:hypothetical protein